MGFDKPRFLTNQKAVRAGKVGGIDVSPSHAERGEFVSVEPSPPPLSKKDVLGMARPRHNLEKQPHHNLVPHSTTCLSCGHAAHIAYHTQRTITTLAGQHHLHLMVRRCRHPACPRYHQPYRPEAEGAWALPHGEYGLDVIALVGFLRYRRYQSLAEIHQSLHERGLSIGERTVFNLLARYEELGTLHMTDRERLQPLLQKQGSLILAVDGLKPDVGHEVLT